jgi:aryl-alcohol dehydrogenase-like predicted oxidoreductase
MQFRPLGKTGIRVSAVAFGAGPVPALMTGEDTERQRAVVARALQAGINWFDTAAGYGNGLSEKNLGSMLHALDATSQVHVATKVRLQPEQLADMPRQIRESLEGSLARLRLSRVTLLQLHNAVTVERGDAPTSITPADVLGRVGVLETFRKLQAAGLVRHIGITAVGNAEALRQVICRGDLDAIQVPYSLVNPSAGQEMPPEFREADYGNLMEDCGRLGIGVFAIRVFAGGALAGLPPSAYTHQTQFFPLDLYHRDQQQAARLKQQLGPSIELKEAALRFALAHKHVSSAIVGFSSAPEIDEAIRILKADEG